MEQQDVPRGGGTYEALTYQDPYTEMWLGSLKGAGTWLSNNKKEGT